MVLTTRHATPAQVVVLAADVSRGETITAEHVSFVGITADAPVSVVSADAVDRLIGLVATADLPAGSFLAEAQLAGVATVPPGFVVLGMRLEAGGYPSGQLGAGDLVDVLALPVEAEATAELLVGAVEVWRAQPLGVDPGSDMFVSLLVPDRAKTAVATAAGEGRAWLGEVSP